MTLKTHCQGNFFLHWNKTILEGSFFSLLDPKEHSITQGSYVKLYSVHGVEAVKSCKQKRQIFHFIKERELYETARNISPLCWVVHSQIETQVETHGIQGLL